MIGVPGMNTGTRRVMKMEKPRPLKLSTLGDQSMETVLAEMDIVSQKLNANNFDRSIYSAIISLCENLRMFGPQLESVYKDQLDRCYVALRNGCRDDRLTLASRYRLLEAIELRAMNWQPNENLINYYKQKLAQIEAEESGFEDQQQQEFNGYINAGTIMTPTSGGTTPMFPGQYPVYPGQQIIYAPQPQHQHQQQMLPQTIPGTPPALGPGEIIKNSGKYVKPIRIPGKNYCKDEVVIRNADSGKVMGLKGRRVHMIEELSETIISFQRVAPGARERLVQITGPNEENISHAKQLIEETIRRNASPVRCEERESIFTSHGGSCSSISSHTSDETLQGTKRNTLVGTNLEEPLGDYRYTVTHENDAIRITGNNLDLVRTAKLILDEYFSGEKNLNNISSLISLEAEVASTIIESPPKSSSPTSQQIRGKSPNGNSATSKSTTSQPPPSSQTSEETSSESSKGSVITVVRQPLIPTSTKEAIESAESGNQDANKSVKNRRMLFAKTSEERSQQSTEDDGPSTPASTNSNSNSGSHSHARITYSRDFLVQCAASPLSRLTPPNWAQVVRLTPPIVKKGWQYLTGIMATMNEKGDESMNSIPTYMQEADCIKPCDLLNLEHRWSSLRTMSTADDDDNGNSNGSA